MASIVKRLPVYLVIDTSGSMAGENIEAVRQGIKFVVSELRSEPSALETACLSIITFGGTAQQVSPLVDLVAFQEPTIDAGGSTPLGEALEVLLECISREVRSSTPTQKGDGKPLIFLMTDGEPTDEWKPNAQKLKKRRFNVVCCAIGTGVENATLKEISDQRILIKSASPDDLKTFFKWVTMSIKTVSESVNGNPSGAPTNLPPPPPQITIMP